VNGDTAAETGKRYWRKNHAEFLDFPLPALRHTDLALDLFPERREFHGRGTLWLRNPHPFPLRRIPLTPDLHGWKNVRWMLNGKPYTPEDRAGLAVIVPQPPLAPGGSLRVGFRYDAVDVGVRRGEKGSVVAPFLFPSSVLLTTLSPASIVPHVGFHDDTGVDEDNQYEPHGGPNDEKVHRRDPTPPRFGAPTPFTARVAVSAPAGFLVNAVGSPVSSVTGADGRHTVVWRTDVPVRHFSVVGGRGYRVRRGETPGTEVFYHPAHRRNVGEMLAALDGARRHFGRWFGPYPWKSLRLTEVPGFLDYSQGLSTNITFAEGMGFLTRADDEHPDAAFLVTAHETAHQWWGGMVTPGEGPGGNILSEGMAEYAAGLLVGTMRGDDARRRFLRHDEWKYLRDRRSDGELPLSRLNEHRDGDLTLLYEKGGWVFTMLEDLWGRDRFLAALREFAAAYRNRRDHPVLDDLDAFLRTRAPDRAAYDAFAAQWFHAVVLPKYTVAEARCVPAASGQDWVVTAAVTNVGTGRVPVTVSAVSERGRAAGARVRLDARVTLGPGESARVRLRCPGFRPERVVVDPDVRVLQGDRDGATAWL
jgi:hypothetical protein